MSKEAPKSRTGAAKAPRGRGMRDALAASLTAETSAFKSRFERAEAALGSAETPDSPTLPPVMAETAPVSSPIAPVVQATAPVESKVEAEVARRSPVVRDSFTMPEEEYAMIAATRNRCLKNAVHVTKAEILRAGLLAVSELSDGELLELIGRLEKVPTGRPKF